MRIIFLFVVMAFLIEPFFAFGQYDTEFWFVAPDVDASHGDSPIQLRLATQEQPATVTVEMPASSGFTRRTLRIAAASLFTLDLTSSKSLIENAPADRINKMGMRILSTAPISAYYEISNTNNPAIYPLKGKKALGRKFFVPFQQDFRNNNGAAVIDIVATQDNTQVTITPTRDLVGRDKDKPFTITLMRGETYAARARRTAAGDQPAGTLITSDKPIAVTMTDDSIRKNFAWDVVGDQIVPVDFIGDQYIVVRGASTIEKLYLLATENNTQIFINGSSSSSAILSAGQTHVHNITTGAVFIKATAPIYALHLSGNGDEMGASLLPPIGCNATLEGRFVRVNTADFRLMVITRKGNENAFKINGSTTLLSASDFSVVPGTTDWVYAFKSYSNLQLPAGQVSTIENSSGTFHFGFLNNVGASSVYGYFSDYSGVELGPDIIACLGDTITLDPGRKISYLWNTGSTQRRLKVWQTGTYKVEVSLGICKVSDSIKVTFVPKPNSVLSAPKKICLGQSAQVSLSASPGSLLYEWDMDYNGFFEAKGLSHSHDYPTFGLKPFRYRITTLAGCVVEKEDTIEVVPLPNHSFFLPTTACAGSLIGLQANYQFTDQIITQKWFLNSDTVPVSTQNPAFISISHPGDYQIRLVATNSQGCSLTTTRSITVRPNASVTLGADTTACWGSEFTISALYEPSTLFLDWDTNGDGLFEPQLSNLSSFKMRITSDTSVVVMALQPGFCLATDTLFIRAVSLSVPDVWASEACAGQPLMLWSKSEAGMRTQWDFDGDGNFDAQGDTVFRSFLTSGQVRVRRSNSLGCYADTLLSYRVKPTTNASLPQIIELCSNSLPTTISLSGTSPGEKYLWHDGRTTSDYPITSDTITTAWVEVTSANGCQKKLSTQFVIKEPPVLSLEDTMICKELILRPVVDAPAEFLWSDGSTAPTLEVRRPGKYALQIKQGVCVVKDTILVSPCQIKAPVLLTPNGDGKNDVFWIENLNSFEPVSLTVFDRWGQVVFSAAPYRNDWRGLSSTGNVLEGTYFYVLQSDNQRVAGAVTILR